MSNLPVLTTEQRADLARVIANRRRLRAEIRVARASAVEATSRLNALRRELAAVPNDRQLVRTYGVSIYTVHRAEQYSYITLNPLDQRARDARCES